MRCLLRHCTQATATEALAWSPAGGFCALFWAAWELALLPLEDWGVWAGGVLPLTLLLWVATLVVGDRWSPSEGEKDAVESDEEKSWWLPQKAGSTPAERDEGWPAIGWPDMGIGEGGMSGRLRARVSRFATV